MYSLFVNGKHSVTRSSWTEINAEKDKVVKTCKVTTEYQIRHFKKGVTRTILQGKVSKNV